MLWSSKAKIQVHHHHLFLTLHLHQELGLDPASRLALVLTSGAAQRVDLVDEDDGWTVFSGQLEQVLHQPEGKGARNVRGNQGHVWNEHVINTLGVVAKKKKKEVVILFIVLSQPAAGGRWGFLVVMTAVFDHYRSIQFHFLHQSMHLKFLFRHCTLSKGGVASMNHVASTF